MKKNKDGLISTFLFDYSPKRDFSMFHIHKYVNHEISRMQLEKECNNSKVKLYSTFKRYLTAKYSIPLDLIIRNLPDFFGKKLPRNRIKEQIYSFIHQRTGKEISAKVNFGIMGRAFVRMTSMLNFWPVGLYLSSLNRVLIPEKIPDAIYVALLAHELSHSLQYGEIDATLIAMDICCEFEDCHPGNGFLTLFNLWHYYSAAMVLKDRWRINHFVLPASGEPFILGRITSGGHKVRRISTNYTTRPYLYLKDRVINT